MIEKEKETKQEDEKIARSLIALDLENIYISTKKNTNGHLDLNLLDDWIHKTYQPTDKIAFLDSKRSNGHRDWLYHLGWTIHDVITRETDDTSNSHVLIRNAIDLELALKVYEYSIEANLQTVLLISGDGDYLPLVKRLKKRGISVHILAVEGCLSKKLEKFAKVIYSLEDIAGKSQPVDT